MFNSSTTNGGQVSEDAGDTFSNGLSNPINRRRWRKVVSVISVSVFISSKKGAQPADISFAQPQVEIDIASHCVGHEDIVSIDSVASSNRISLSRSQSSSTHVSIGIHSVNDDGLIVEEPICLSSVFHIEQQVEFSNSQAEDNSVDYLSNPQARNDTNPVRKKGLGYFLFQSCKRSTIILLSCLSGLFFAIDIKDQGANDGWHDGVAILVCTFLLVTVPSVQNFLRERKLVKRMVKERKILDVEVTRDGHVRNVANSEVLEGDIVHLKKGDYVPANGILIENKGLVLDEVLCPHPDQDQNSNLFSGSKVIGGQGLMRVTSIAFGANGNLRECLSLSIRDSNDKTLLHVLIDKSFVAIDKIALFVCVLIALQALIRLLWKKQHPGNSELPEMKGEVSLKDVMKVFEKILLKPQGRVSILASTLVAFVIVIQHGMPFVISLSLCQWNEKLVSAEIDPRNLAACATMGLVEVIIIDVTGGLLCNQQMEVKEFWMGEKDVSIDESACGAEQDVLDRLHQGISVAVHPEVSISPINDILVKWMNTRWGMNIESSDKKFEILKYKRFSSSKKGHGVLVRKIDDEQGCFHLHWKGAASAILNKCSHFYDGRGKRHLLQDQIGMFEKMVKDMENNGLTPIAFACGETKVEELQENGLNLFAILGLKYTCPEEIKIVVEKLKEAGITIKLVSEDKLRTLQVFASELGLSDEIEAAEGQEIQDIESRMDRASIIGSCNSKVKFLIVDYSKKKGQAVAFFGGLTSRDILALKRADLVITRTSCRTHMANEFSDISIGGVSSLTLILKNGKCAYHNIQRFFQLQLTACLSSLTVTLVASMISGDSPLTSLHLIWVNLIISLLGWLMMVMELNEKEQFPNCRSLLTKDMFKSTVIQVTYQVSVLLIFEFVGNRALPLLDMNKDVSNTIIFNTFTLCQLFNQFNVMGLMEKKVLLVVFQSSWFLGALGAVLVMQVTIVELGIGMLGCVRLSWLQWIFCFFIAALSWGSELAAKWLQPLILRLSSALAQSTSLFDRSSNGSRTRLFTFPIVFPLSMLFVFFVSCYFQPQIARTFR